MERLSLELRTVHRRITADFDAAPDVDELARGIEQAVCQLAAAAQSQSQSQGSST